MYISSTPILVLGPLEQELYPFVFIFLVILNSVLLLNKQ